MNKLLNENNAAKIFGGEHTEAHGFMKKGGVKYISAASLQTANPEKSFTANKIMANGGIELSSSEMGNAPQAMSHARYNTAELSHGSKESIDPTRAAEIVKKAEMEIVANRKMAQMKINY